MSFRFHRTRALRLPASCQQQAPDGRRLGLLSLQLKKSFVSPSEATELNLRKMTGRGNSFSWMVEFTFVW